ncbi:MULTISPECIES: hypothetical protein [unclassified Neisseria]|nr:MULTISPECIES: hypothetical protein [unclassified Neisseria]
MAHYNFVEILLSETSFPQRRERPAAFLFVVDKMYKNFAVLAV